MRVGERGGTKKRGSPEREREREILSGGEAVTRSGGESQLRGVRVVARLETDRELREVRSTPRLCSHHASVVRPSCSTFAADGYAHAAAEL